MAMTWLAIGEDVEGHKTAVSAARRAAKQRPKALRSASVSYLKQGVKEKWRQTSKIHQHIKDARKSVASRYLQLNSGQAVTAGHLLRLAKCKMHDVGGVAETVRQLRTSCWSAGSGEGSAILCCGSCAPKRSRSAEGESRQT